MTRYMTCNVITVTLQAVLRRLSQLLDDHLHQLVIVSEEAGYRRPISVVSASDLIYHILKG